MNQNLKDNLWAIRHTCQHVLSQAMEELYGQDKIIKAMGPATDVGFYFDFDTLNFKVSEDMFPQIEAKMQEIINKNLPLTQKTVSKDEAQELFKNNLYKLEWIEKFTNEGQALTVYKTGDEYLDLCAGPHTASTGDIKAFKLLSIAGAYWHGDEKNKMLTRIYGTAFFNQAELDDYIKNLEEAKSRDHRKLGKELKIFFYDEEVGPGLPLWQPNGAIIIEELESFAKQVEEEHGYSRVKTPQITKEQLFLKSGHLPYYAESMFAPMEIDGEKYYLKPMNCPFHHKIFGHHPKSYRELPVRLAEYGTCYRYEQSGELMGLMRVRSMQMNDAHIYCTEEQFESEFKAVIDLYMLYFKAFGIEKYQMRLSKHSKEGLGKKYVNNPELWEKTEDMVRKAMISSKVPFFEAEDEAAFYGPKIDVQIFSAIGREFTIATNQVDFAVPERFGLVYTDADGSKKTPLCIHRAPLGTHERTIGFLLEHFAGAFPLWLSPIQVSIVPISEDQLAYAQNIASELKKSGLRVQVQDESGTMQGKIKYAQEQKIPYMLILGKKEQEANTVSIRTRDNKQFFGLTLADLKTKLQDQIQQKSLDLLQ